MRLLAMFCKKNGNMYVANNSSILQYCHGMPIEGVKFSSSTTQQSFVDLSTRNCGRGGGLTARRKRKLSLLRPPSLFFMEVGRKRGEEKGGSTVYLKTFTHGIRFINRS